MPRATFEQRVEANIAQLFNTRLLLAKARRQELILENEIDDLLREVKHLEMQQRSLIDEAMESEDED